MAISMDMKYTALYWALRFVENELDVHVKEYSGYKIIIDAEKQMVNYGDKIKVLGEELNFLKRHKDFVILECKPWSERSVRSFGVVQLVGQPY